MARQGLTRQECDQLLEGLRRECTSVSDDLLVWFAESFALDATCEFDLNDLIAVLNSDGEKVISRTAFSDGSLPASALQMMIRSSEHGRSEDGYRGGVLIFRATKEKLGTYWGAPIGEMMSRFKASGRSGSETLFGVLTDERVVGDFEIFTLRVLED